MRPPDRRRNEGKSVPARQIGGKANSRRLPAKHARPCHPALSKRKVRSGVVAQASKTLHPGFGAFHLNVDNNTLKSYYSSIDSGQSS
jgi:hypothetical protein